MVYCGIITEYSSMGIFEIEKYEINDFVPDLSQSEIVWILSIWIG